MASNYEPECDPYYEGWKAYPPSEEIPISTTGLLKNKLPYLVEKLVNKTATGEGVIASTDNFGMLREDSLWTQIPIHCSRGMASNYEDPFWKPYERSEKIHISTPVLGTYIYASSGAGKDVIASTDNFGMPREDSLWTQIPIHSDKYGFGLMYGNSLEFGSVEMLRMANMSPFSAMKLMVKLGSREVVGLIDSGATRSFISPFGSVEMLRKANMSPFSAMKLMVKLGSREVVGLIDSGATRSFISPSLAAELNLPFDNSVRCEVQLGNGMCCRQEGICRKVDFQVQGIPFTDDFLPFELGDVDVILGFSWLKTLGPVLTDWNNLTMEFKHGDSSVCLSGDPSLSCQPADLHAILAWEYLSMLVLGSISVLFQSVSMQ